LLTILKQYDYIDTARKCTVSLLLVFFAIASANQWKSFRHEADLVTSYGLLPCDYSTVSKKVSHVPFEIYKEILALALSRCNREMRRVTNFPKELLWVDSTTITVDNNRLAWTPYHGERSGVKLHIALKLSINMPKKVIETTGLKHDSPVLDELVDTDCIIVADRAYLQIKPSDRFVEEKVKNIPCVPKGYAIWCYIPVGWQPK